MIGKNIILYMGGNALKNVTVARLNKNTYNIIKKDLYNKLNPYLNIIFPIELPEKMDFGDIDLLYTYDLTLNIKKLVKQLFNPKDLTINGTILSFSYEYEQKFYQIDLIHINSSLNMAHFYFSYADTGTILGRICYHYGLKLGHDGLFLKLNGTILNHYNKENIFVSDVNYKYILLSDEPKTICNYLGLDEKLIEKIPKKNKHIYDWIIKSKYFHHDIFLHLKYDHRKRLSYRVFYQQFLDYIEKLENNNNKIDKMDNILYTIKYFNIEDQIQLELARQLLLANRKKKFNGSYFKGSNC